MYQRFLGAGFSGAVLLSLAMPALADQIPVQILSAVVRDQKIPNATVILQENGQQSVSAATDAQGMVSFDPTFADNDSALLIVKKEGYSNLVVKCPCKGMSYAISPVMTNLDGMRVVLNWGKVPADLDLHVAYPNRHIYWWRKTAPGADANLDIDHIDGFGPETITIEKKHQGESYVFAVHNYSNRDAPNSTSLSTSGAKVLVYIGQSLVRSYYVPQNMAGNLWTIFRVNEAGEFEDINTMRGVNVDAEHVLDTVNTYLSSATHIEPRAVSAAEIRSATTLNRSGETAYHAGDLEGAVSFYRQAIDIDPNYGQAYSNLGLAYQKLNRTSEAIWADRKAIALASGNSAATTRAGSYYNIARIYEAAGQFADALQNYESAKRQKDNPVYSQAIERVRAQIH